MKRLALILAVVLSVSAYAGLKFINVDGQEIGVLSEVKCTQGVACAVVSGKVEIGVGQQDQVTGTSTVATSAMCGGTYISNGATTITLPEASTVVGCRYTFIVGATANLAIDPADGTDQIKLLTNAAGDSLIADAIGESIVLQAYGDDTWAAVGKEQGTWTDSD